VTPAAWTRGALNVASAVKSSVQMRKITLDDITPPYRDRTFQVSEIWKVYSVSVQSAIAWLPHPAT
jgi:hypothetical protein